MEQKERPNILIVDDELGPRESLGMILKPSFNVFSSEDGKQALQIIKNTNVDIVTLDLKMPVMSGEEVLKRIKAYDPTIEVVIITGYGTLKSAVEAIKYNVFDYILKPFSVKEVLGAVQGAISKRDAVLNSDHPQHELRQRTLQAERSFSERTIQLRESQIKYKQIIDSSMDGIVVVQNGEFSFVNPKMMDMLGYAGSELLRKRAMDLIHPEDHSKLNGIYAADQKIRKKDPSSTYTVRAVRKDKSFFWAEINSITTLWEGKLAVLSFVRDISARKRAEEMLRQAQEDLERRVQDRTTELLGTNEKLQREIEERKQAERQIKQSKTILQGVFDGISDPLIMVNKKAKIMALNKAASEYFEVEYSDAVGKPSKLFLKERSGERTKFDFSGAAKNDRPLIFEREFDEDPYRLEKVFIYPLKDHRDQNTGFLVRINDVTEEKMMEKRLTQSEKLASLGLLLSGIAHEINNPNNFIFFNIPILRSYLEELMPIIDEYANSNQDYELLGMPYQDFRQDLLKLLDNMEHGAARINATVSRLKEFSKLRNKENMRWIDLNQLIEDAVAICQGQINKMVQSFEVDIPDGLPKIHTEPGSLEQILINLLINAAQAANKKKSWVRLEVKQGDSSRDQVSIEISDNGCGMNEQTRKRIFEPFFTTKNAGSGTGLGLYICHNLIGSLGGVIEVESRPGRGSKFKVVLPVGQRSNQGRAEAPDLK